MEEIKPREDHLLKLDIITYKLGVEYENFTTVSLQAGGAHTATLLDLKSTYGHIKALMETISGQIELHKREKNADS